jgi:putative ABC transport system permease protein
MKTVALAFRYLWAKPLAAVLNVLLLSLGLASASFADGRADRPGV